jgi:hypothetical protein
MYFRLSESANRRGAEDAERRVLCVLCASVVNKRIRRSDRGGVEDAERRADINSVYSVSLW